MNDALIDKWKGRAAQAQENRVAMPTITEWVDYSRHVFGDGIRVTYAAEAGREIGKSFGGYAVNPALLPKKIRASRS